MTEYPNPVPPAKKRKILIFGVVPVLLLLLAVLLYVQFSPASGGSKLTAPKINMPVPDHARTDTGSAGKSDLYAILEDREKKDSEGKAVFNTNEKLNLNPGGGPDQELRNRLNKEVVKPSNIEEDPYPSPNHYPISEDQSSIPVSRTGVDPDNASFNSIVIATPDEKKPAFVNPVLTKDPDINCPASIVRKSKIVDGASVTMELQDDLTCSGKTLPKGSQITAIAQLQQTRVDLRVNSVNIGGTILSVRLSAYDTDGVEGLRIQGNPALKKGASQTMDDQIEAVGTDAESQITGFGGQAVGSIVRNLVHPGGRRDEATIPAGYKLILKTE